MRTRFALISIAALTACSPYAYDKEITTFATAASAVTDAAAVMRRDIQAHPVEAFRWETRATPDLAVRLDGGTCSETPTIRPATPLTPCAVLKGAAEDRVVLATKDGVNLKALDQLNLLSGYVKGLQAITNAKDSEEFAAAYASASKSASSLVSAVLPAVGPAAGAALQVIGALARTQLELARLEALRKVTRNVDPKLAAATDEIGDALNGITARVARETYDRLESVNTVYNATPATKVAARQELLSELLNGAQRINKLRAFDGVAMMGKLSKAHNALTKALSEKEPDLSQLISTINEFATAAKALKDAFGGKS